MESLDRNSLNTEIVQLRHDVQRVKVIVLRNMVRKVEQLKSKKGTQEIKMRNEKKAERLIQEIHELKSMKTDAVTKFALKNSEKNCLKVIANADSSINSKCLARIASEKSFVAKLKTLEDKYYNWEDAASLLLPAPKKGKKKSKKGVTSEILSSSDDDRIDKEEELEAEDGTSISEDVSASGLDLQAPNLSMIVSDDPGQIVIPASKKQTKIKQKVNSKNKQKDTKTQVTGKNVEKGSAQVPGISVVRKIRHLEDLERFESSSKNVGTGSVGEARKDSFFLSANGEEVESEVEEDSISESQESEDELDQGPNKVYHSRGRGEGYEHRRTFGALNNQEIPGKHNQKFSQKQPQLKRFDKSQSQKRPLPSKGKITQELPTQKPEITEKLHPSWEAKRRLKESLQLRSSPQNKKIKFDD